MEFPSAKDQQADARPMLSNEIYWALLNAICANRLAGPLWWQWATVVLGVSLNWCQKICWLDRLVRPLIYMPLFVWQTAQKLFDKKGNKICKMILWSDFRFWMCTLCLDPVHWREHWNHSLCFDLKLSLRGPKSFPVFKDPKIRQSEVKLYLPSLLVSKENFVLRRWKVQGEASWFEDFHLSVLSVAHNLVEQLSVAWHIGKTEEKEQEKQRRFGKRFFKRKIVCSNYQQSGGPPVVNRRIRLLTVVQTNFSPHPNFIIKFMMIKKEKFGQQIWKANIGDHPGKNNTTISVHRAGANAVGNQ